MGFYNIPSILFFPEWRLSRIWHAEFLDQNPSARLQSGDLGFEDKRAVLVGPVVQDPSHVVHVCNDALRLK